MLGEIEGCLSAGSSLHGAMAQYEDVFEPHWIGVIQTGEISGKLGLVLADLNRQIREQRQTRRKLMGAMIYPATLVVVAVAAVSIMLWLVVPTFADMFRDMGAELPGITKFVMDASDCRAGVGAVYRDRPAVAVYLFRRYLTSEVRPAQGDHDRDHVAADR